MEENFKKTTQKPINLYVNEFFSKPPKENYSTNKTDVYHIDDVWSLDIFDLKGYGPKNNKNYRYVSVIIDNFSKLVWIVPLKIKNAQKIKYSSETILISSKKTKI